MFASQTHDYEYPYSLVPGTVRSAYALRVAMGFGARRLAGGGGAHAAPVISALASCIRLCSKLATALGVLSASVADAAYLCHLCRNARSGFGWTARLRVGPPG